MIYPSSAAQLLASRNIYGVAIVLLLLWVPCYSAHAQVRCGTVEYMEQLRNQNKIKETKQDFENWLSKRIGLLKTQSKANRSQATTYQVPVVVHVIHNGEAVGVGSNISDAQIQSQIDVINDDYKRLNADATNTPSAFSAVAGIMDIEFILAKQDPEGLPTSGIVRVNGNKSAWTMNDNTQLKSLSYWPAEDYLNLWVCNLTDLLGYTQFPVSDLPGLENASKNRLTDGVVIAYEAFGTVNEGPFELDPSYDLGRTATHEIGHFFGLRHIWGDDDSGSPCSEDDYVADTPLQATSTTTCPSGVVTDPCTTTAPGIMYENYLDYTDDACMNVFTQGQVDRMQAVIESSPRRASLLSSHGLQDPVMVANDLGIRSIIAPEKKICDPQVTSVLEVRNYGTNAITSTKIQVSINGSPVLTQSFSVSLSVDEITTITLNPVTVDNGDALSFDITETNGGTDNNSLNNNAARTITFQNTGIVPFDEPMDALPSGWTISNPDSSSTWTVVTAPNGNSVNKAMQMNFYDYDKAGETDRLLTPVFDFAPLDAAALHFDVSYAQFPGQNGDSLKVVVLTDCENDISKGTVIYAKGGSSLSTSPSISASFNLPQPISGDQKLLT